MNILLMNAFQTLVGGTERYFFDVLRVLRSNGHRVITLSTASPANVDLGSDSFVVRGVDTKSPSIGDLGRTLYNRQAYRAIQTILDSTPVDVAHVGLFRGQLSLSVIDALDRANIPTVYTAHDFKLVCPVGSLFRDGHYCEDCQGRHFWHGLLNRCNRRRFGRSAANVADSYFSRYLGTTGKFDRIIMVSRYQAAVHERLGVPRERIRVIYNLVEKGPCPSDATTGGDYVLYAGRLAAWKGVETTLEAASRLPEIPFLIAGSGDLRDSLEKTIARRYLSNVSLVGQLETDELREAIDGARMLVVPSESPETFGLSAAEAMGRGKCVVCSDAGSLAELAGHASRALVFPAGDSTAMAEAIHRAWHDARLRRSIAEKAYQFIDSECSPQQHYEKLVSVYREAIDERADRTGVPAADPE